MLEKFLPEERSLRCIVGGVTIMSIIMLCFHEIGYTYTLSWGTLKETITENFFPYQFSLGPFQFGLEGQLYSVTEKYVASEIRQTELISTIYVYLIWVGLCGLLAVGSYWKRFWFLGMAALILVFINMLDLDSLGVIVSSPGKKWWAVLVMILTIGPAYFVHAIRTKSAFPVRWVMITFPSLICLIVLHTNSEIFIGHFIANSTIGLSIACLLLLVLVGEELVFLILYFITQAKGGKHNEKHLLIFGLVYLGYLSLYYAKKAGFVQTQFEYLNPYYLLIVSCMLGLWSLPFKQLLYNHILEKHLDIRYLLGFLTLVGFAYLTHGFVRGNDPVYESMHYLIVYAHLGFGFMMFAYILVNFITPLVQGLKVYRITYTEQNFPYVTARLGGFVIMAAFFFYSDREAQKLIVAGKLNYTGDVYQNQQHPQLAAEYFTEGSQNGWDNHYSNYRLGTFHYQKSDLKESLYRFNRATKRHPSPYAFINTAVVFEMLEREDEVPALLREGQAIFPANVQIRNNLGLLLGKKGLIREAHTLLKNQPGSTEVTDLINKWAIINDSSNLKNDYLFKNTALKANILARSMDGDRHLPIDTTLFLNGDPESVVYLINALWYSRTRIDPKFVREALSEMVTNTASRKNLLHAEVINLYQSGYVNEAFLRMDNLVQQVNTLEKGFFYDQLGILALDQKAYVLAEEMFNRAVNFGFNPAILHVAIAQLEAKKWDSARDYLDRMVEQDSGFVNLRKGLVPIVSGNPDGSYAFAYYRYEVYPADSLITIFQHLDHGKKITLWEKIKSDYLNTGQYVSLRNTFTSIRPFLPPDEVGNFDSLMVTLEEGATEKMDTRNAFQEYIFRRISKSDVYTTEEKYELLVEATQINPYSAVLQKLYCMSALDNGLYDYADEGLNRLATMIPASDFLDFQAEYEVRKKERLSQNIWE